MVEMLYLSLFFLLLFALGELMYHYFKVKVEWTRKFIHAGTGLLALLFPIVLDNHWQVLILCFSFFVLLVASLKFNYLPSINRIDRKSWGSLLYPLAVYLSFLVYSFTHDYSFYYLPLLILAFCDSIAALMGKKWPLFPYAIGNARKTVTGSTAFFLSAFGIAVGYFYFAAPSLGGMMIVISALCVAVVSTGAEAVCGKGWDNFIIPMSVIGALYVIKLGVL